MAYKKPASPPPSTVSPTPPKPKPDPGISVRRRTTEIRSNTDSREPRIEWVKPPADIVKKGGGSDG